MSSHNASKTATHTTLTEQDIEKLATLSRLTLAPEEKAQFAKEIDAILAYVEQIQEVVGGEDILKKLKHRTPDMYVHRNVLREDVADPLETDRPGLVSAAPESQDGYIKVKKIINEK